MAITPRTGVGMFGPTVTDLRQQYLKNLQGQFSAAQSPYERMGLALGNILGTAFGVKDPALEQASTVQSIYSAVAMNHPDQTTPEFYRELANTFAAAGLNEQALMSSEKAREVGRLAAADLRAERGLAIQEEQLLLQQVDKDPYGSIERAMALPDTDPRKQVIITGASAKIGEKNTAEAMRMAEAAKTEAQTKLARAQLGQLDEGKASEIIVTEDGYPLSIRKGKYFRQDGIEYKGKIKKLSSTESELAQLIRLQQEMEGKNKTGGGDGKKSKSLSESIFGTKEEDNTETTPAGPVRSGRGRPVSNRVPTRPPEFILRGANTIKNKAYDNWMAQYGATHNPDGTPK